jgi:hypothetical protein
MRARNDSMSFLITYSRRKLSKKIQTEDECKAKHTPVNVVPDTAMRDRNTRVMDYSFGARNEESK